MTRWIPALLGLLLLLGAGAWFLGRRIESAASSPGPGVVEAPGDEEPPQASTDSTSASFDEPENLPPGAVRLTAVTDLDPELREGIRDAMRRYIDSKTVDGKFIWIEPEKKLPIGLAFTDLHDELFMTGNYYLSCAEFSTGTGYIVDIDIIADVRNGVVVGTNNLFHEMRPAPGAASSPSEGSLQQR